MDVFLETKRMVPCRLTPADLGCLLSLHNDPIVMRFLDGGRGLGGTKRRFARGYQQGMEQYILRNGGGG